MISFLRWGRSILFGALNGIAKFALVIIILVLVLFGIGLAEGDGLPGNMVLALDLREPIADSQQEMPFNIGTEPLTVMNVVLALDAAERDPRVKGVWLRVGSGDMSVAQAEEIGAALKKFRASGKFVIAHSQGFLAAGVGDYLTASSADEIWMQPKATFGTSGVGGGEIFLRGLFDKIQAEPQIAKRADYKSAADMYMEKGMTGPDREQLTELMQSWYSSATQSAAQDRKLDPKAVAAAFDASPQFTDEAKKAGLIDKVGYDDDSYNAAISRAGDGAKAVKMQDYIEAREDARDAGTGPHVALIEASGEIVDGRGSTGGLTGGASIGGDDLARAIREATRDKDIKAILLRVDSPGGSVSASDQILDALKKARASGKPVVVSMGALAASGGYYISCDANEIVAEPGTITGSIGVLTGKVSFGKTIGLVGVSADQVSIGKNTLFDSSITPFTPDQWANLNHQADVIYADFTQKVADGRKMPLAKVQEIAKGRVWTGADASSRGLVDRLGGFWTATEAVKRLAGIPADTMVVFERYPRQKGFFEALDEMLGGTSASIRTLQGLSTLMNTPPVRAVLQASDALPRDGVELRATNLPVQ
jgi:protease-4